MKTSILSGIILFFFAAVWLMACNDGEDEWYSSMKDGGPFMSGNQVRFYYVDAEGNDLIDRNDPTTFPVSSDTLTDVQPAVSDIYTPEETYAEYNNRINSVFFSEKESLNEFFTFAYSDSRQSTHTFYVYFRGKCDTMEVTYRYDGYKVTDVICNRLIYSSQILSWKVNGQTVYSLDTWKHGINHCKVYLQKDADGNTVSVTFRP